MISNKAELTDFISSSLKPYGFKKRKNTWYFETDESISTLALTKSSWSNQFYLDIFLIVKALLKGDIIKNSTGGEIMWRIDELYENKNELNDNLNFDDINIHPKQREIIIKEALLNRGLPFLQGLTSINGIKDLIIKYPKFKYCISDRLWRYLNLDVSRENHKSSENLINITEKNPFIIKILGENDSKIGQKKL
jgi:hypothetical protein